jgi:serine/threonine-protein kinase
VALKLLPALPSDASTPLRRFLREISALSKLDHPNIVRILDSGIDPAPFLAMELVPGRELRAILAQSLSLPAPRAIALAAHVAHALAHAHERGVVHRDVKPENVLVDERDQVKLVDFGIALLDDSAAITRTGEVPGTPAYLAPEQVAGGAVGPAADVYALGLVLYEMLAGERAFPGDNWLARATRPPPRLAPDVRLGTRLADLVLECCRLDAAARPTAADLARRLEELAGDRRSDARATSPPGPQPEPSRPR